MTRIAVNRIILRELIFVLLLLILPTVILFFVSLYLADGLNALANNIYSLRQQMVSVNAQISAMPVLSKQIDSARAYTALINNILPTKDTILSYPTSLNALARNLGLLQTITFSNEVAPSSGNLGTIQTNFQETGSLKSLASYLGYLRQKLYAISFDNFSISGNQDIRTDNSNQMFIQGTVYMR